MQEIANKPEDTPCSMPIPVVTAVTAAEWLLGMPPVLKARPGLNSFVAKKWSGIFTTCANTMAIKADQRGKLEKSSKCIHPFSFYRIEFIDLDQLLSLNNENSLCNIIAQLFLNI